MLKIVGSTAAYEALKGWQRRSDLDVWTTQPLEPVKGLDACVMSRQILEAFESDSDYASLNDLYTIKLSHLPYDIFWWKHVNDALVFKKHGAQINQKLYTLLQEHWKKEHGNKEYLNLYRNKDQFFDDYVEKKYDHDWLHELVAYPNTPVYTRVLKDGEQVATDTAKFLALPLEDRIKMLREEMNVIMVERWLLNDKCKGRIPFIKAWQMSLRKTTTALTKGVYSATICENLMEFIHPNKKETEYLFKTLGGT